MIHDGRQSARDTLARFTVRRLRRNLEEVVTPLRDVEHDDADQGDGRQCGGHVTETLHRDAFRATDIATVAPTRGGDS